MLKSAPPKLPNCHLCGRQFGTTSLGIHLKACKQRWEREHGKPAPEPEVEMPLGAPMGSKQWEQFNEAAQQKFNTDTLQACPNCGRTFLPDRLPVHLRSCASLGFKPRTSTADGEEEGGSPLGATDSERKAFPSPDRSAVSSKLGAFARGLGASASRLSASERAERAEQYFEETARQRAHYDTSNERIRQRQAYTPGALGNGGDASAAVAEPRERMRAALRSGSPHRGGPSGAMSARGGPSARDLEQPGGPPGGRNMTDPEHRRPMSARGTRGEASISPGRERPPSAPRPTSPRPPRPGGGGGGMDGGARAPSQPPLLDLSAGEASGMSSTARMRSAQSARARAESPKRVSFDAASGGAATARPASPGRPPSPGGGPPRGASARSSRERMAELTAEQTGKSVEQVLIDNDRDNWFTAQQALEYGFVDHLREFASDVVGGGGTNDDISNADAIKKD